MSVLQGLRRLRFGPFAGGWSFHVTAVHAACWCYKCHWQCSQLTCVSPRRTLVREFRFAPAQILMKLNLTWSLWMRLKALARLWRPKPECIVFKHVNCCAARRICRPWLVILLVCRLPPAHCFARWRRRPCPILHGVLPSSPRSFAQGQPTASSSSESIDTCLQALENRLSELEGVVGTVVPSTSPLQPFLTRVRC